MARRISAVAVAAALALASASCRQDTAPALVDLRGSTMGTSWHVRAVVTPHLDPATLSAGVQRLLDQVDGAMSTWKPDSEVSRFNDASLESDQWFPVSESTARLVRRALSWCERSDGAFDITVGPLVELWGFGPEALRGPPEPAEIRAAMKGVGGAQLEARLEPPALQRRAPGLRIDLSAIAKGYASDLVVDWLRAAGIAGAMTEVGGEVRCFGLKPDGSAWAVGIEEPVPAERVSRYTLELRDRALASSGDYRNFREAGSRRVSHTIDPRTGHPAEHDLAGVSVSAESCADADALCTALMVMGAAHGYAWAVEHSIAARFVRRTEHGFEASTTPRFEELHGVE